MSNGIIAKIRAAFENARHEFEPFIECLRFPRYKNFEKNSIITFDFPLTVFIGKNGSGKSSALHALYGVPKRYSTGKFWFSTKVDPIDDPIDDNMSEPHCHIHRYRAEKHKECTIESLKTRIKKEGNPDYWEPSRPLKKYDMEILPNGKRHDSINKKVIYLDFRAELSAFDQFFYFGNLLKTKNLQTKQDVIRKWSRPIKRVIDDKKLLKYRRRSCRTPIILSHDVSRDIEKILGKSYVECVLVEHNFYDSRSDGGTTIYFKTDSLNYSEAFAGRGEFAVVKLIQMIHGAKEQSLVILDEPEVSLHPGAQKALKQYLLEMTLKKHLQVVISTHSEHFIEDLPESAVKLFAENSSSSVKIHNWCHPSLAFKCIGTPLGDMGKAIIFVEDITAKTILDKVLVCLGDEYPELFHVCFYHGGAEDMFKSAVRYSEEKEFHKFLLLDGDKNKVMPSPDRLSQGLNHLSSCIRDVTGIECKNLDFRLDGTTNTDIHNLQKKEAYSNYLTYLHSNMRFLPGAHPEEMLWDEEFIENHVPKDFAEINECHDYKKKILSFTQKIMGATDKNLYESVICMLAKRFVEKQTEAFQKIKDSLDHFKKIYDSHKS